jgi:hypothetical protein
MKKITLSVILAGLISIANAEVTDTAKSVTAGNLNIVANPYLKTVTNLTITGTIDARDFKTMRDSMPSLAVLNLSKVTIVAYTGTEGTQYAKKDTITYPANAIPGNAFYNQQTYKINSTLTSVTFPFSVTNIGDESFLGCYNLSGSLILPSSVTYIGEEAFFACSELSGLLNIPSSVDTIGSLAFYHCIGFTGILTIPSFVSYIGDSAFAYCAGLKSIRTYNPVPLLDTTIGSNVFLGDHISSLNVPCGSIIAYESAPQWNNFNVTLNESTVPIFASVDTVIYGSSDSITADTSCLGSKFTLQWQVNGINTGVDSIYFIYFPKKNGDTITCTAIFSDTAITSNAIIMIVKNSDGINIKNTESFNLYPNPNDGNFTIAFSNPDNQILQIIIADITGNTVFTATTTESTFNYTGNKLQTGIYVVTIKGNDSFNVCKMVVKK